MIRINYLLNKLYYKLLTYQLAEKHFANLECKLEKY